MKANSIISAAILLLVTSPSFAGGEIIAAVPIPGTAPLVATGLAIGISMYLRNRHDK